ncbi:hypothetical protein [Wukongibacter sp. M2B1]|uniref:hypothetical protein n=1 Tax=Wukongibacter sp. M2B1 TaxID=3088895 RepID=UPI003D7B206C
MRYLPFWFAVGILDMGIFSGPRHVIILITLFSIPLGIVTYYVWPVIAAGLQGLTKLIHRPDEINHQVFYSDIENDGW